MAEYDSLSVLDLIVEEFTEILHIHLALFCVDNGNCTVKRESLLACVFDSLYDVGELSYTRGFDENSVGREIVKYLFESNAEVSDKRAADASRIHFGDVYARFAEKCAVDTDLAEFVFDANYFFFTESLGNKLFNKSGLSRTEKSRKNISLGHNKKLLLEK